MFDIVRSSRELFNQENLDEWRLAFDTSKAIPAGYAVIQAERIDRFARMTLAINEENYAVENVDYEYRWKPESHNLDDSLRYSMTFLRGRIMYERNQGKYFVRYIQNHFAYKVHAKLTWKFRCEREVMSEAVTFESQRRQVSGSGFKAAAPGYTPIIVDRGRFCEAVRALGRASPECP